MGQAVIEELLFDMLTSFPVPAFFMGPDQPGDPFQALDGAADQTDIGFELSDPALDF